MTAETVQSQAKVEADWLRDFCKNVVENQLPGSSPESGFGSSNRLLGVGGSAYAMFLESPVHGPYGALISHQQTQSSTDEVIGFLERNGWTDVAQRLQEIRSVVAEEGGSDIDSGSALTLSNIVRRNATAERPRIGVGDDGMLDAVWSLGSDGIFTVECFADNEVGCAILLDSGARAHSKRMPASEAGALIDCFHDLGYLSRDAE